MAQKFSIQSIEIEGFRGINEKKVFNLDKSLVFLFGNNGFGKSSVLAAIEWCLFGDVAYIRYVESRTKDELINTFNLDGRCKVKISLRYDDQIYTLTREKELGTRDSSLSLKTPQEEFSDAEAQAKCFTLFILSFDDFYRAVYLHQESIRGLLTDDPKERDESMDRLFGLERMRDIIESVPLRDIKATIEDLRNQKDKIEERTKGAITQCGSDLQKLEEEAEDYNLSKDKQTLEHGKTLAAKLIMELNNVAKQSNLVLPELNEPKDINDLNSIALKIKSNLSECRKRVVEVSEFSNLTKKKTEFENLTNKLEDNKQEVSKWEIELKTITKEFGNSKDITAKVKKIKEEMIKLGEKRKDTDVKFRLVADAIECLDSTTVEICPVCNSKINRVKLIKKLKSEIENAQQKEIKQIDASVTNLKGDLDKNEEAFGDLERANKKLGELDKAKKKIFNEISELLEQKYSNENELMLKMKKEFEKICSEIKKVEKIYEKRAEEFQKIADELDQLKTIYKIIKKKEEFNEIKVISPEEDKEIGNLKNGIDNLELFEKQLNDIMGAMTNIQIDLATEMIEKSAANIKRLYSILCNHPYYDNLQINVKSRNVKGYIKNSYTIKAFNSSENKETTVSTRFSTGQMNCVALSVYLSLSKVLPHKLGFLILDDPSQNLDIQHKEALCKVLKEIKGDGQIIIATQDDELQRILSSTTSEGNDKLIYTFEGWNKRTGPKISES